MKPRPDGTPARQGIASVLALMMMVLLSTIAVGMVARTDMSLRQGRNCRRAADVRLAAESGLNVVNYALSDCTVDATEGQELLDAVAEHLAGKLDGTANLDGEVVAYDGEIVSVPEVAASGAGAFTARLWLADDETVRLEVTGRDDDVDRTVSLDYQAQQSAGGSVPEEVPPEVAAFFGHGIASRSKIRITGNASVTGMNSADEAEVLSATYSDDEALKMTGNADIGGAVYFSNPDAYATLTGNITIKGVSSRDDDIWSHIHAGIGPVEFPEVDASCYEPFATNVLSGDAGDNQTLTNVRIPAGTNPTISGNTTIRGVVYIEAPNRVHFSGNVDITGVVVTEDAGDGVYDVNTIKFTGNTSVQGVEQLPDAEPFRELRQMPGTFLLAPGFSVEFTGNFGTVSGTMAADRYKFTGNAGGVVKGMIVNYSDSEFKLTGNSHIVIDRSGDIARNAGTDDAGQPAVPPGFAIPGPLSPVPDSYREY